MMTAVTHLQQLHTSMIPGVMVVVVVVMTGSVMVVLMVVLIVDTIFGMIV